MEKIAFRECTMTKLDRRFGLKQVRSIDALHQWLAMPYEVSDFEKNVLMQLQLKFNQNQMHWNEYELVSHFVVPIFSFVNFTTEYFNDFGDRLILNGLKIILMRDFILPTVP